MGSQHPLWGARIRAARRAAGLTQAQLAAALKVSQQNVSAWEKGLRGPRDDRRLQLARILGIAPEDLFTYTPPNGDNLAA